MPVMSSLGGSSRRNNFLYGGNMGGYGTGGPAGTDPMETMFHAMGGGGADINGVPMPVYGAAMTYGRPIPGPEPRDALRGMSIGNGPSVAETMRRRRMRQTWNAWTNSITGEYMSARDLQDLRMHQMAIQRRRYGM